MLLVRAPRAADGDVLLTVRDAHCEIEAVVAAILRLLAAGDGVEIDQQQDDLLRPLQRLA